MINMIRKSEQLPKEGEKRYLGADVSEEICPSCGGEFNPEYERADGSHVTYCLYCLKVLRDSRAEEGRGRMVERIDQRTDIHRLQPDKERLEKEKILTLCGLGQDYFNRYSAAIRNTGDVNCVNCFRLENGIPPVEELILVFGSNLAGRHGKGAALFATLYRGAVWGQGVGRTGKCYAIPTKNSLFQPMTLEGVAVHVKAFLGYAKMFHNLHFQVTRIGCGPAGFHQGQIAPLFKGAGENVHLPHGWEFCQDPDCAHMELQHGFYEDKEGTTVSWCNVKQCACAGMWRIREEKAYA